MRGTAWTLAGEYRVASDPSFTVDVLAGTRLLDTRQHLRWNISGSIGPLDPAARAGEIQTSQSTWDAIVGVKGRYAFGQKREWAVPIYLDVGAGESQAPCSAAGGLATPSAGRVTAMWRYLRYDMKSSANLQDVSFSGPLDRRDVPLVVEAAELQTRCGSRAIRRSRLAIAFFCSGL
jgi:hypothetical protein